MVKKSDEELEEILEEEESSNSKNEKSGNIEEVSSKSEEKKGNFKLSGLSLRTAGVKNSWKEKIRVVKDEELADIERFFQEDLNVVDFEDEDVWGGLNLEEAVQEDFGFSNETSDKVYEGLDNSRDFYKSSEDGRKGDFYSVNRSGNDLYRSGNSNKEDDGEHIAEIKNFYDNPTLGSSRSEAMREFENSAIDKVDFREDYLNKKNERKYG